MKKIITSILFLACFAAIQAQTFDFVITPYNGFFSRDFIEVSENGKDTTITRKGQLDTASIVAVEYGEIRQAYNRIARLEASILETWRLRNAHIAALNAVGLNDYFATEIARVAPELDGNWIVVIDGSVYRCDIENASRALRIAANDTSGEAENTVVGALIPRSRLYIDINPTANFETVVGENVTLFSSDGSTYYGQDSNGAVYRLRKL